MMLRILTVLLVIKLTTCEVCEPEECKTPKHYEELGCEPVKKKGDCCASSFDCPDLIGRDTSKCYFKNETLNPGEILDSLNHADTCEAKCYCNLNRAGGQSEIYCSHRRCTEKLPKPQQAKRCLKQYDSEHCCPVKAVCDDDINKLATCDFEGRKYHEGERMYPKNDCYKCFCAENFDDKTSVSENENCHKIDCGIAYRQTHRLSEGCIPVYIKTDDCCPVGWRCPGERHMKAKKPQETKEKCRFGNMYLKVGESLDLGGNNCQNCTCSMPPMLHCIQTC